MKRILIRKLIVAGAVLIMSLALAVISTAVEAGKSNGMDVEMIAYSDRIV